jgi:hypothetical protein
MIAITSPDYEPLLCEVRNRLLEIDSASLVPAFDRCNPGRCGTVDRDRDQLRAALSSANHPPPERRQSGATRKRMGAIKDVADVRKDRDHAQKGNSRVTHKP